MFSVRVSVGGVGRGGGVKIVKLKKSIEYTNYAIPVEPNLISYGNKKASLHYLVL